MLPNAGMSVRSAGVGEPVPPSQPDLVRLRQERDVGIVPRKHVHRDSLCNASFRSRLLRLGFISPVRDWQYAMNPGAFRFSC